MNLSILSIEELREVSLQKNRKGCATADALRAQKKLLDMDNSFARWNRPKDMSGESYIAWGSNETGDNR